MILFEILIILRVTNAVSSFGQKVCISIIKPREIKKESKKKTIFSTFHVSNIVYLFYQFHKKWAI